MAINSFDQLLGFFHELSNRGILLDGMDFHTHGVADELGYRIGISFCTPTTLEETLNYINARRFSGLSRSIFKAGANITFYGCAVGRVHTGEYFLSRVGTHCLSSGGGTVRAYSVLGYANIASAWLPEGEEIPSSFDGEPDRNSSTLVIVNVRVNGSIARICNASYLTPQITRNRVNVALSDASLALTTIRRKPTLAQQLTDICNDARGHLSGLSGHPSYTTMFEIWRWLEQINSLFPGEQYFPNRQSQYGTPRRGGSVNLD